MSAQQNNFIWPFVTANFADNILLFDRAADFIWHAKTKAHLSRICRDGARKTHSILARNNRLRNFVQFPIKRIRVTVKQFAFASAHPKNRPCAAADSAVNYSRGAKIFLE